MTSSANDLLELDSSLQNEYASHLLSGKSLPINFNTWNHTNQSTGNDKNFSAHIARAVTRLKSIFITLHKPDGVAYKQVNDFYHPCSSNGALTLANEHSYQVQIGADLVPEYPVNSLAESYSKLKKTVGRSFKMHSSWYRSRKYIIGLDLEKSVVQGSQVSRRKQGIYSLLISENAMHSVMLLAFLPGHFAY